MKLRSDTGSDYIRGESNATIYINCATQNIILQTSKDMRIIKVKLKSANNGIDYITNDILDYRYEEYVVFNFVDQLLPANNLLLECGVYTLYVKFSLPEHPRELLRTWYTNEKGHEK